MSFGNIDQISTPSGIDAKGFLDTKLTATVSPKNAEGISGWIFDIPEEVSVRLSADVTDHYTEDGSFINDHVVIKPIELSLSGLVGELVYKKKSGFTGLLSVLSNKLETIDAFFGDLTPSQVNKQQKLLNKIKLANSKVNQEIQKTKNIVNSFSGKGYAKSKQEEAYQNLETYFNQKRLVTVQTPWKYYESMILTGINFSQDGETGSITNISITLKELRFAEVKTTNFDGKLFAARNDVQKSDQEDGGNKKGKEYKSTLVRMQNKLTTGR